MGSRSLHEPASLRRPICVAAVIAIVALAFVSGAAAEEAEVDEAVAAELGDYEQRALAGALERRGLVIDEAPEGKRLGRIIVVNLDVFVEDDWAALHWLNAFHRTTREKIIAREVLLRPGQLWNKETVEETERKLRDPISTTLALAVPVQANADGFVDLLVVTRDVWSLRLNSSFELQESELTYLTVSLAENNFLGWRKLLSLVFELQQGSYSFGPLYIDKNVLGKRVQLSHRSGLIFSRETGDAEGSESATQLARPLWSLRDTWAAGLELSHRYTVERVFQGTALRTYDNPDSTAVETVPWQYRQRRFALATGVTRGFGDSILHRVSLGHELSWQRPQVLDEELDDAVRRAFERDVLPRSERVSAITYGYEVFTPNYRNLHNIDTFDLTETVRTGPALELNVATALQVIGSEDDFLRLALGGNWTLGWLDGYASASSGVSGRWQDDKLIDKQLTASLRVVTPTVYDFGRLVAAAQVAALVDNASNTFFSIGGQTGLRGYPIGAFIGERLLRFNVEARSVPLALAFLRVGGVAFWDAGDADERWSAVGLHHDVGLGLRMLIPQLSTLVYRIDWAVPFDGPGHGLPGRFTAGAAQVF